MADNRGECCLLTAVVTPLSHALVSQRWGSGGGIDIDRAGLWIKWEHAEESGRAEPVGHASGRIGGDGLVLCQAGRDQRFLWDDRYCPHDQVVSGRISGQSAGVGG